MRAEHVAEIYQELEQNGVAIWIDGGWAVDAIVGRETRSHSDLDIAVEAGRLSALRDFLAQRGYSDVPSDNETAWNFVLADGGVGKSMFTSSSSMSAKAFGVIRLTGLRTRPAP